MKKLLKHISPLAPDDSGACSVLYEMGGITVICDAGGCAGNVCGFDEPRWFEKRSALFSAGLRDMDAILGRDDMLVKKLSLITEQIDAPFTAIVGTPVPAVIATDLKALERMSEKKTGLPCIALKTDGTRLYDCGEEMAYYRLFDKFAEYKLPVKKGRLGVLGATPLNIGETDSKRLKAALSDKWNEVICFGMDSGLDDVKRVSQCERLLVIAPSGLKAARLINERFNTPYDVGFPMTDELPGIYDKKILIIHQQFYANALREHYEGCGCDVAVGSFFMMIPEYMKANDIHITEEDELIELALNGGFDVILADERFRLMLKGFGGSFIDLRHFAVGGRLNLG